MGNSSNAESTRGDTQYLHFEIRIVDFLGEGLGGRLEPATRDGTPPIGWAFFESHGQRIATTGAGLKVAGINVRGGGR